MNAMPDAAPPALQDRSRRTQERIFRAGVALLEEGGQDALTVSAVAAAAGVAVGSVYRRFGDKSGLLAAIQAQFTQDFRAEIQQRLVARHLGPQTPSAAVVEAAVSGVTRMFEAHAGLMRVFMLMGLRDETMLADGVRASHEGGGNFRTFLDPVVPLIRHEDPEAACDVAFRLVYAACAHRLVHGEHLESPRPWSWDDLTREVAKAVTLYLLGSLDPAAVGEAVARTERAAPTRPNGRARRSTSQTAARGERRSRKS